MLAQRNRRSCASGQRQPELNVLKLLWSFSKLHRSFRPPSFIPVLAYRPHCGARRHPWSLWIRRRRTSLAVRLCSPALSPRRAGENLAGLGEPSFFELVSEGHGLAASGARKTRRAGSEDRRRTQCTSRTGTTNQRSISTLIKPQLPQSGNWFFLSVIICLFFYSFQSLMGND